MLVGTAGGRADSAGSRRWPAQPPLAHAAAPTFRSPARSVQEAHKQPLYCAAFNLLSPHLTDTFATVGSRRVGWARTRACGSRAAERAAPLTTHLLACWCSLLALAALFIQRKSDTQAPCCRCLPLQATVYKCLPDGELEVLHAFLDANVRELRRVCVYVGDGEGEG